MDLNKFETELEEIEAFLAKPDAYNDPEFATKNKRAVILRENLDLNKKISHYSASLEEAESLVNDPELGEIAKEDINNLKAEIETANLRLEELLIPHNPVDDTPALI